MEGEEYGQPKKIRIGQRPIFEKRVLTPLARKMSKNVCHSARNSRFPFFLTFWEQLEFPVCFSFHVFGCGFIFPMDGRSFL